MTYNFLSTQLPTRSRSFDGIRLGALEVAAIAVLAAVALLFLSVPASAQGTASGPKDAKWKLTRSDEFNGPNGSGVDSSKWVTLTLDRRAFSFYDVAKKDWNADAGEFTVLVGGSSDNVPLRGKFILAR